MTSNYVQPISNNVDIIYDTYPHIKINSVLLPLIIKLCYQLYHHYM